MLKYRYLARLELQLAAPIVLHAVEDRPQKNFNVLGGTFSGGRLNATVFADDANWLRQGASGVAVVDLHTAAQFDNDGPLVAMCAEGRLRIAPATLALLADPQRASAVEPGSYILRITAYFASADPRADWLNHVVAVGTGELGYASLACDIFEVL